MKVKFIITALLLSCFSLRFYGQGLINSGANILAYGNGSYWRVSGGDFTLTSRAANKTSFDNLGISSGTHIYIDSRSYITVTGTITNNAGTSGFVIKSDVNGTASLLHNVDNLSATIQRYLTGSSSLTGMMYHMVSVPLTPATSSFSSLFFGSYLFDFTENSNIWRALGTSTTNVLDETRGYMTYYPLGASTTYTYTGSMNNGSITPFTALTSGSTNDASHGWNLVPNPFPSAIDWNASTGWTKTNIDGSIYFWPAGKSSDAGNYATWNGTTGTGTPQPGTQFIPVGQSFFVHATSGSPVLSMTNNVRVHNAQAFWKKGDVIPNLLRITTTINDAHDDIVINFREDATPSFDGNFDAYKLQGGSEAPQLSSLANDGNSLSINSLPFGTGDIIVPLKFTFSSTADVSFTASGTETFSPTIPIYLEDISLGQIINLRQSPVYSFHYEAGSSSNRFQLRFSGLNAISKEVKLTHGKAYFSNDILFLEIPAMEDQFSDIIIVNALGQQIGKFHQKLTGLTQLPIMEKTSGVYIIHVNSGKQIFTTKIVKN